MMWLMYHETGNIKYREIARNAEKKLDRCFEDYLGLHYDVGFMYLLSAVADYRLTEDEDSRICDYGGQGYSGVFLDQRANLGLIWIYNIIYGDYYFMEAMFKLKGDDVFLW